jgi:hypothetical protein
VKLSEQELSLLLNALALTREDELNCDECLAMLAQFAEREVSGEADLEILQRVRHHLLICTDCREEHDALLKGLRDGNVGA